MAMLSALVFMAPPASADGEVSGTWEGTTETDSFGRVVQCAAITRMKYIDRWVYDDEIGPKVRFTLKFYLNDCPGWTGLHSIRVGFYSIDGTPMNCGINNWSAWENVGPIGGLSNPPSINEDCVPSGNYHFWGAGNERYYDSDYTKDRCAGEAIHITRDNWPDSDYSIPELCVPRG